MRLGKRAFLYVTRKPGKTLTLLLTLFVITVLLLLAYAVNNTAEENAARLRASFGGYFKLEDKTGRGPIENGVVGQIGGLEGVKSHNAMGILYQNTPGLTLEPGRFTRTGEPEAHIARFLCNTDTACHEYFITRAVELVEGRHIGPADRGKALVSLQLAQRNNLSLGDIIESIPAFSPDDAGTAVSHQYEIVGIYDVRISQGGTENAAECDLIANFIFTDIASYHSVAGADTPYNHGAIFLVNDPGEMENVLARAKDLSGINWEDLSLVVYESCCHEV